MKQVLVIDNHDSFVYNLIAILKEIKNVEYTVIKNDEIDFNSLKNYKYILISPGPNVPNNSGDLLKLIDYTHKTHSIFGVCLGHQAINQYFGGTIKQFTLPKHGHKSILNIIDKSDIIFKNIENQIIIGRYHSWTIDKTGKDIAVSSLDDEGNIMSIYHKTYNIHSVQFHPESIITNYGKEIISNWLEN